MITIGLVLNAKSMTLQTQVAGVMMRETLTFMKHVVLMRSVTRLERLLDFMEDGVLSVTKVAMLHWSQSLYLLLISLMVCPLFCLSMAQEEIYLWKMLEMDIVGMQLMGVVKGRGETIDNGNDQQDGEEDRGASENIETYWDYPEPEDGNSQRRRCWGWKRCWWWRRHGFMWLLNSFLDLNANISCTFWAQLETPLVGAIFASWLMGCVVICLHLLWHPKPAFML